MNVQDFDFDYSDERVFNFGLMSDIHIDAKEFQRKKFHRDMEALIEKGARIYINGDLYDGIFPTDHKRYSRGADGFDQDAQINARVEYACKELAPYADYIDYIGFGNHEVSIVKYNNTDILHLTTMMLNQKRSDKLKPIQRAGYTGFINLKFSLKGERVRRFVIYRTHGVGGASPVTRGMIGLNRLYTTFVADLYWMGHSHNQVIDQSGSSIGVSPNGKQYRKPKIGIVTAGYHGNFGVRNYGPDTLYQPSFAEERFHGPTALGCGLLTIRVVGERLVPEIR